MNLAAPLAHSLDWFQKKKKKIEKKTATRSHPLTEIECALRVAHLRIGVKRQTRNEAVAKKNLLIARLKRLETQPSRVSKNPLLLACLRIVPLV
jgi:hypothetical protein